MLLTTVLGKRSIGRCLRRQSTRRIGSRGFIQCKRTFVGRASVKDSSLRKPANRDEGDGSPEKHPGNVPCSRHRRTCSRGLGSAHVDCDFPGRIPALDRLRSRQILRPTQRRTGGPKPVDWGNLSARPQRPLTYVKSNGEQSTIPAQSRARQPSGLAWAAGHRRRRHKRGSRIAAKRPYSSPPALARRGNQGHRRNAGPVDKAGRRSVTWPSTCRIFRTN